MYVIFHEGLRRTFTCDVESINTSSINEPRPIRVTLDGK